MGRRIFLGLLLLFAGAGVTARAENGEREIIQDNHFQRGFILWKPASGQHVRYGELKGFDAKAKAIWGLAQWSSKFPLPATGLMNAAGSVLICSNSAKSLTLGASDASGAEVSMAVNSGTEYGTNARKAGEPWVHLLVEQEFAAPAPVNQLSAAKLHVEARLLYARNLHRNDYSPGIHAAQFQIFFTVQNRNRRSPGYGDLLWFGVPLYDNRHRFAPAHKTQDFGGTAKFIFTPEAKTFTPDTAHDGKWIVVDKDLLPLMREALETAWARGFLAGSKEPGDYHIGGMNMGWELPGTFEVEMQVRNLSLKLVGK